MKIYLTIIIVFFQYNALAEDSLNSCYIKSSIIPFAFLDQTQINISFGVEVLDDTELFQGDQFKKILKNASQILEFLVDRIWAINFLSSLQNQTKDNCKNMSFKQNTCFQKIIENKYIVEEQLQFLQYFDVSSFQRIPKIQKIDMSFFPTKESDEQLFLIFYKILKLLSSKSLNIYQKISLFIQSSQNKKYVCEIDDNILIGIILWENYLLHVTPAK